MEDYNTVLSKIRSELRRNSADIRDVFFDRFEKQVAEFEDSMTRAFLMWKELDTLVSNDINKGVVAAVTHSAVVQQVMSFKLLISGYLIPSGNLQRQVAESIAMAALFSCKELDDRKRFLNEKEKYPAHKAVTRASRIRKTLNMSKKATELLVDAERAFGDYSHISISTVAAYMNFEDEAKTTFMGAAFDEGKIREYGEQIFVRNFFAKKMDEFIAGVIRNVQTW